MSLGELRAATGTGDPYELLSIVREVGDRGLLDRARRERLAAAFLAADLPWSAVNLLGPIKSQLGHAGRKTFSAAALALRIIRHDAASVAPGSTPYHGLSATGARLLDLLGVPLKYAGPYSNFTSELAERIRQEDKAEDRLLRGPSLLEVLLGAAKPQSVEYQFEVTSEQLSPMHAAADSPVIASLSRVMHPADDDTTTVNRTPAYLPISSVAATLTGRSRSLEACRFAVAQFFNSKLKTAPNFFSSRSSADRRGSTSTASNSRAGPILQRKSA